MQLGRGIGGSGDKGPSFRMGVWVNDKFLHP